MTQQSYRCAACGGEFDTQAALRAHAEQYHAAPKAPSNRCIACGGEFDTQEALQAHAKASHAH